MATRARDSKPVVATPSSLYQPVASARKATPVNARDESLWADRSTRLVRATPKSG